MSHHTLFARRPHVGSLTLPALDSIWRNDPDGGYTASPMEDPRIEIERGQRFRFGENWARFLEAFEPRRIDAAIDSLKEMLSVTGLTGKTFVDAGSGSGLFSLAARRLGARVVSFDCDPRSVACTEELRRRYSTEDDAWRVELGSALDPEYLRTLGQYDVVYSWGVLHHTGKMWEAMDRVGLLTKQDGLLFVAIYNDQGIMSKYWRSVKRLYNRNRLLQAAMVALHVGPLYLLRIVVRFAMGKGRLERGMSLWYDMLDWLGGYPFEVATPEAVVDFYHRRGFRLEKIRTCGGHCGCNEYVFRRA